MKQYLWFQCFLLAASYCMGSEEQYPQLPWQTGNSNTSYHGKHNDLPSLLRAQAFDGWITVFAFSAPFKLLLLNCLYSLITFGKVSSYIVTAFDSESLRQCLELNLPCYNGTHLTESKVTAQEQFFNSPNYLNVVWSKVKLAQEVVQLNYTLHYSDVDVVYLKDIRQHYKALWSRFQPDAFFNVEDVEQLETVVNSGVYVLSPNTRTIGLLAAWAASRRTGPRSDQTDQGGLNSLLYSHFAICTTPVTCALTKKRNLVAVYRMPTPNHHHCITPQTHVCAQRILFIHAICIGDSHNKAKLFQQLKLWFIDGAGRPFNERPALPCQPKAIDSSLEPN